MRELVPLRQHVELVTPNGRHYRWGTDEPLPENVPSGLRYSSTMPGGFETCECVLPRREDIDYDDLERLSTLRVLGPGGDVAGEYRLERAPRVSGAQMSVSPSAVGWQAALEDNKDARDIYVDIDLTRWGQASVQRRINAAAAAYDIEDSSVVPDVSTGQPALVTSLTGAWGRAHMSEALYDAHGIQLGSIYYAWKIGAAIGAADANWVWAILLTTDDVQTSSDTTGSLRAAGPGTGILAATTATKKFITAQVYYAAAGGTAGLNYPVHWTCLAVYGNHGLTKRGTASATTAQGFYASDVVAHAVTKWAPTLNTTPDSIVASSFVIPHLVFLESTTAGEIVRQASRFGLDDWAVWEGKTFYWAPRNVRGRRWRARISPAQLEETGPQVDRLWNRVVVQYGDVDGSTRTVGAPGSGADVTDTVLQDTDPENPANQAGIIRCEKLVMGTSTVAGATEVGRRFLEQSKLLDRSGRARLTGYVEDDHGILHPYSRVRAGDLIAFVDAADSSYRRIVRADIDTATRSCSVDLDAPPEGLQALLERLGVVLVPLGIT